MPEEYPSWIEIHPRVMSAIADGQAIVVLESAVITHGLPLPHNLEIAKQMESEVLTGGAQPATVAMLDGRVHLGLSKTEMERLANETGAMKISLRDLSLGTIENQTGGTTVAATMFVAHKVGLRVFATGGIGGVHHGGGGDISADLPALANIPVAVVCAGAKSIVDLPRTLEWLETAGVPVVAWGTDTFPAFFSRDSGLQVEARVEDANQAAALVRRHWEMGLKTGVLISVPCPAEAAVAWKDVSRLVTKAEREAQQNDIGRKALTPFLLQRIAELSDGRTLRANLALLRNNARKAALLATALIERKSAA